MAETTPPRLYLVTPPLTPETLDPVAAALEAALATGLVACLRLEMAAATPDEDWPGAINALLPRCHAAEVPLVVTDRPALVAPHGIDGVHLSASDASIARLRKTLGPDVIIGAAGGTERHRAMVLAEAGADYVAIGPAEAAGDALYAWWSEMIETPVVAEGGIDLATARRLGPLVDFATPDPALVWDDPAAALPAFAEALGPLA